MRRCSNVQFPNKRRLLGARDRPAAKHLVIVLCFSYYLSVESEQAKPRTYENRSLAVMGTY